MSTINKAFHINVPVDPKLCILGILDMIQDVSAREAAARALFQAHKLILVHWIFQTIPTLQMLVDQIGITLHYEKLIYLHRGNPFIFEKVWGGWLDTPGLAPVDLVLDGLLL